MRETASHHRRPNPDGRVTNDNLNDKPNSVLIKSLARKGGLRVAILYTPADGVSRIPPSLYRILRHSGTEDGVDSSRPAKELSVQS